jgi:predicted nucleic acid-binding protein
VILIDTGGLIAAIDPRQSHHVECARVIMRPQTRILSPFVLAELDYLITRNSGPMEARKLLQDVARGAYQLETFGADDVAAALAVIDRYADLDLGLADASIVVLAERYDCPSVLTLDHRHFRVVLGPRGRPFHIFPFDDS